MKYKLLKLCTMIICSFLLLSGCASNAEETEPVNSIPADAIFPVMSDHRNGIKSRRIELFDKTIFLPEGYVYGKVEHEDAGYTTYYVWQDKRDKEYSFELDADVMLYIYDGLDVNSPHKEITKNQALSSMKTGYMNNFANLVTLRNRMPDAEVGISDDGRYYTFCFTGNSGEYITTTYADSCFPKTYYGIYTLEVKTRNSDRHYYGFIFSNDSRGEIFKQSEYENLLSQIKTSFGISKLYSLPNAAPEIDFSNGRSYRQLVAEIIYEKEGTNYFERGLFYNTLLYYIETTGRNYVRKNVDGSKSQAAAATEATTEPTVVETESVIEEMETIFTEPDNTDDPDIIEEESATEDLSDDPLTAEPEEIAPGATTPDTDTHGSAITEPTEETGGITNHD